MLTDITAHKANYWADGISDRNFDRIHIYYNEQLLE